METFFGTGEHLDPMQMSIRAFLMFLIALILIRIGGLRIVGKKSGFDLVIVIMMGAVLARGVVGASSFLSTVTAALVMILLNKALAWCSLKSQMLNKLIKGEPKILFENGKILKKNLDKACLSESDLISSLKLETHEKTLNNIECATLETNGRISFVFKPSNQ